MTAVYFIAGIGVIFGLMVIVHRWGLMAGVGVFLAMLVGLKVLG